MATQGSNAGEEKRRTLIAAAKASGKTHAEAAEVAGCSVATVTREMADPRTQSLLQRLREREEPKLSRLFALVVEGLERDLLAADDVETRRKLRAEAVSLLLVGEPREIAESGDALNGGFTLQDVLVMVRGARGGETR